MKILFVLEYFDPHIGGVELLFKQLANELLDKGHELVVLTNRYDVALPKFEKRDNLTIHRYRFFNRYLFTFMAWIPAIRLAKRVDVIHTTSYNAAIPAYIAARFANKKAIITFHEYWGELWYKLPWIHPISRRGFAWFEKLIVRLNFDRFVGVSEFTCNALRKAGINKDKIVQIYNGINYLDYEFKMEEQKCSDQPYIFCFFGRPSYSKGLDLLLPAFAQLVENGHNVRLRLIIPNENYGPSFRVLELVKSLNLHEYIDLRHDLSFKELKGAIQSSNAVVIPSYSEGFCFAAAESVALGMPIISSQQGALIEVVSRKFIATKELNTSALREAMILALQGDWQTSTTKTFPIQKTIDKYISLYKDLLNSN